MYACIDRRYTVWWWRMLTYVQQLQFLCAISLALDDENAFEHDKHAPTCARPLFVRIPLGRLGIHLSSKAHKTHTAEGHTARDTGETDRVSINLVFGYSVISVNNRTSLTQCWSGPMLGLRGGQTRPTAADSPGAPLGHG